MDKNQKFVITINRELGSGGRTVGEKLAEKLGVSFYDKAVIMGLEEKYHLTVDEIEKMRNKKHHWWSDFKLVTGIGEGLVSSNRLISETGKEPDVLTTETMFKAESEILEDIANVESCVIAGRSGFYVFRNHPNHLRVMIQASLPFRIKRLVRKKGITEEEARKIIEKVDKMRENYVKKFTGTTRYDTRNYDIVISADGKTEDQIVDQILLYIEQ
jgi:cytidylate kinase